MEKDPRETSTQKSNRRKRRFLLCLQKICRMLMLILFSLWCIIYFRPSASFHQKQLTQPASLPHRFFPIHGQVADFFYGELQPVIKLLGDEELVFVMYYAPWDAKSVHVRGEFIRAAKVLSNTVKFVAVNCWYTNGECRSRMKFLSFPQLFIYHSGVADGYRFTGIHEAEYFIKFTENFLAPLHPLNSDRQIKEFMASNDNAVIGYFDFNSSPQPPGPAFHQFYLTALRVISYDFYQPVKFGVVRTAALAKLLDLNLPNRFVLSRIGNTTLKYPLFYNMTSRNMTTWILHYKQKNLAAWLVPPEMKSLTLSLPLQLGPAVLVFAPTNPLHNLNPYHDMIQLASLAFRSCGENTDYYIDKVKTYLEHTFTRLYFIKQFQKKCLEKKSVILENTSLSQPSRCCVCLLNSRKVIENSVCEYCVQKNYLDRSTVCDINFGLEVKSDNSPGLQNSCSNFYQFYNVNEHHSVCCKNGATEMPNLRIAQVSGQLRRSTDLYVINGHKILCKQCLNKLTLEKTKYLSKFEDMAKVLTTFSDIRDGNLTGLQCRTNKSVNFYYLDSIYHSVMLQNLKVPYKADRPTVILVDLFHESVFLLREKLNFVNLAKFVLNYTSGLLIPYRRSSEVTSPSECSSNFQSVCIIELTAETFHEVVLQQEKDVFVMFYSHWCGFCDQVTQVFLSAAQFFQHNQEIVFARLNGDGNDLPWEYTVEKYPTLILFPAYRKSESILFPDSVAKTLPNVIRFLLYHVNQSVQIDTAVSSCSESCIKTNKNFVISKISELEVSINQLERRALTLWSQTLVSEQHRKYTKAALETVRRAQDIRNFKLRKAQMLNHLLQNGLKKLDRSVFLSLVDRFSRL